MRLITNADFDGVLCASMIADKEPISEIVFAHPKDVEDGLVKAKSDDIIANLPYTGDARMWFDHHSGRSGLELPDGVKGRVGMSDSAARLIYEYYEDPAFAEKYAKALEFVDRYDAARLTYEEVLKPDGWMLLAVTLDPRTELDEREAYALEVIGALRKGLSLEELLKVPSVQGRVRTYIRQEIAFKKALMQHTYIEGNVSITDFRKLDPMPVGNRFLVFALFARCNVNVRIFDHRDVTKVTVAVGKSIFDRTQPTHIGQLMQKFGGGGLPGAGTCPLPHDSAEGILGDIVTRLNLTK